jgi:uroporphyrinogen decarboxylase
VKEKLTPVERFGLLVIDEPQDRVPVFPLITSHAARVLGVSLREYVTDGATMARAQLVAQDRYGHDFISLFSEVGLVAEALGSEFEFPEDDLPVLKRPKWNEPGEVDDRVVDPVRDGRLKVYLDAILYAYEARGDRVPVLAYIPGPFTTAQHLVAAEEFLLGLLTRPDNAHGLLRYATRSTIAFSRAVINQGGLPILVDPLASGSVISPEQYREFALPYEHEVIRYWHRYDLDVILHICGETELIIDDMPEAGADLISIDRIELGDVVRRVGDRVRVIGNFGTSDIWLSSVAEIESAVEAMVRANRSCPMGYVASTGCEVPVATPPENVDAFVRAARQAGLNPDFGLVSDRTHA